MGRARKLYDFPIRRTDGAYVIALPSAILRQYHQRVFIGERMPGDNANTTSRHAPLKGHKVPFNSFGFHPNLGSNRELRFEIHFIAHKPPPNKKIRMFKQSLQK